MKNSLLVLLMSLFYLTSYAQPQANDPIIETTISNEQTGEIVFIRSTGISGMAVAMRTFIDKDLTSKLNNKRYSIHKVEAGQYDCVAQFYGKKPNSRRGQTNIDVKAGEKKYVMLVMDYGWLINRLSTVEVTEASALRMMAELKEDKRY